MEDKWRFILFYFRVYRLQEGRAFLFETSQGRAIAERLVRYLSRTSPGRVQDKRICDAEAYTFPPGCVLWKDSGFQGFEPEEVCTYHPKRQPRNHERSAEEKAEHTVISSMRILVEHVIARVKRCRMVPEVFRNTQAPFEDLVREIAGGLQSFRTTLRSNTLECVCYPHYSG